jgi:hypothetical protein
MTARDTTAPTHQSLASLSRAACPIGILLALVFNTGMPQRAFAQLPAVHTASILTSTVVPALMGFAGTSPPTAIVRRATSVDFTVTPAVFANVPYTVAVRVSGSGAGGAVRVLVIDPEGRAIEVAGTAGVVFASRARGGPAMAHRLTIRVIAGSSDALRGANVRLALELRPAPAALGAAVTSIVDLPMGATSAAAAN